VCAAVEPQLTEYAGGHLAACHHPQHVTAQEIATATRSPATPLSAGELAPEAPGANGGRPVPSSA
jgi:peptide/nickel transport system ATP-binding protein/oligopeptide transport system ATP-binding protein